MTWYSSRAGEQWSSRENYTGLMRTALALLLLWLPVSAQTPFGTIEESIATLSKFTGLRPLKKVTHDVLDKKQLKAYLEKKVKDEVKPEEIRIEELTLKKFGLVPDSFDMRTTMVDLLTEQAAAFYDYHEKKLYLMKGSDPSTEGMFVFHELAHALADQHFDLAKFIRKGKSDDSSMARMAVMEGQATWLMYEYMASKMGQSLKTTPKMADMLSRAGGDDLASQYPVLSGAPLYIRSSLLFPYIEGFKFQNALIAKLDQVGFARPFKDPPLTTHQVLHPDDYLKGEKPTTPALPKAPASRDWTTLTEGTMGEFDHAILLEQYAGKDAALAIAPQWRGGSYALLERKKDKAVALLYASEWRDEAAAKAMFQAYRKVLTGKWKTIEVQSDSENTLRGHGDDGAFEVTLTGTRVLATQGLN